MRTSRRAIAGLTSSLLCALGLAVIAVPAAHAAVTGPAVRITEFAYGGLATGAAGGDGEYAELTNIGDTAQSLSNWTYGNSSDTAVTGLSLSALGTVAPGESVIVTDLSDTEFRTEWGLKSSVKVLSNVAAGAATHTLNKGPTKVQIWDASQTLVDSVSYASGFLSGKGKSAWVDAAHVGANADTTGWTVSAAGDSEGSWVSAHGAIGSPGASTLGTGTPTGVRSAALAITGGTNQSATVNQPFTYAGLSASGGTGSYTWTATGLDGTGLGIDAATGAITGTPTATGTLNVTVTVTDGASATATTSFTITVATPLDPNWANIVINEITSDNNVAQLTDHLPAALATALGANAKDLVELYNKGDQGVDITGWKQIDSGAAGSATVFSGRLYDVSGTLITTIPAHGYGVFNSGAGLGSGGDAVKIYLPDGTLVDSVSYGAGQAGYDESLGADQDTDEIYHALARCDDGAGAINSTSADTSTWFSVKAASFGSSNDPSCDTSTDPDAAVTRYNEQPPTGLPGTCAPSAPSGSDGIAVADAAAWPTSDPVTTVDNQCEFVTAQDPSGNDMSSLVFSSDGSVLWGAQNKNHLWKLEKDPSTGDYLPATDNDWGAGKGITFTGTDPNASQVDSEGLTIGGNGDLFVTSERDNTNSGVSKDEVLEYDTDAAGTTLAPVQQWDLTSEFVPSPLAASGDDANLGFEGVTFVPDSFLTAHGFRDQHLAKTYDPADYAGHGSGLFFLALEKTGHLYAYALNSNGSFQRVAEVDTGIDGSSAIADVQFNADDQGIWTDCDNDCGVVDSLLKIDADGNFVRVASYRRPSDLPDDNLEGFAIAPASTATDGKREVVWSDDGIYGEGNAWNGDKTASVPSPGWGHALYAGTIPVSAAPTALTGTVPATGTVGTAYTSSALTPAGGFPAVFTYSLGAGTLPGGLILNSATGAITGTPTTPGTYNFTISVWNGVGTPATHSATVTIAAGTQTLQPSVSISGSGVFGTVLTADVGTWDAGVAVHYQWKNGTTVLASDTALTLNDPALVGRTITLSVTGTKAGFTDVTKTASLTIKPGVLITKVPTISGSPTVGSTLAAHVSAWGPAGVQLSYSWFANGLPIVGATGSTLRLSAAQFGKAIAVKVTGTKAGYATASTVSSATMKVKAGTIAAKTPTITGPAKVGKKLTAKSGTWQAGTSKITYRYQWYANGKAVHGATKSSLNLNKVLRGKRITVKVTASAAGYTTVAKISKPTKKVK